MAGRKSVEPDLAASLQARNHKLDDHFSARILVIEEKKKKVKKDDEPEDSSDDEDHLDGDDGCHYVERVGVRDYVISHVILTLSYLRYFVRIQAS